jgi:hypothetical protein
LISQRPSKIQGFCAKLLLFLKKGGDACRSRQIDSFGGAAADDDILQFSKVAGPIEVTKNR